MDLAVFKENHMQHIFHYYHNQQINRYSQPAPLHVCFCIDYPKAT